MAEITHDTIKLAVMEGLDEYDKKREAETEKMCQKNVEIAIGRHTKECPGANKGNISGMSGLGLAISLTIERIIHYFGKGN